MGLALNIYIGLSCIICIILYVIYDVFNANDRSHGMVSGLKLYFYFHLLIVEKWVSRALISSHVIGPIFDPHNIPHNGLKSIIHTYILIG